MERQRLKSTIIVLRKDRHQMKAKVIQFFLAGLLIFQMTGCHIRPNYVLDKDKMKAVTRDIILTDAYLSSNYRSDSVARLLYESVFTKYGISRAQYDSSYIWYAKNASNLSVIYDELNKELSDEAVRWDNIYNDSIRDNRIHFIGLDETGYLFTRQEIPSDHSYFTWRGDFAQTDTIHANDTLSYAMILNPTLREGEMILFVTALRSQLNQDRVTWVDTIKSPDSNRIYFDHVIPTSYQPSLISIQMTYTASKEAVLVRPRLIDSLRIGVRKKFDDISVASDSTDCIAAYPEVPTDSVSGEEIQSPEQ